MRATLDNALSRVITSDISDFSCGIFSYVQFFNVRGSFAVNADDMNWGFLAERFLNDLGWRRKLEGELSDDQFEEFLIGLSYFVHHEIDVIHELSVCEGRERPVCRHYSTYIAVLFSKILKMVEPAAPYKAFIQVPSAMRADENWGLAGGHAWNLVTIERRGEIRRWHYDAFNYFLVKIDDDSSPEQHKLLDFIDPHAYMIDDLTAIDWLLNLVRYTIDRYSDNGDGSCLYSLENEAELLKICGNIIMAKSRPHRVTNRVAVITNKRAAAADNDDRPSRKRKLL